jgi:hypothetical protein
MSKYRLLQNVGLVSALLVGGVSAEKPMTPKQLSPHFEAVASKLEMGGLSFSYKDKAATQAMVKGLLDMTVAYLDTHTDFKGVDADKLVEVMALDAVEAVGSSASQQDGYVHYRSYTYTPEKRSTYAMAYGEMKPSVAMQLAPAGADLVAEMHFNGSYDPDAEEKLYAALGPVGEMLKQLNAEQENAFSKSYQENYHKINSRITVIGDISPKGFKGFQGLPLGAQVLLSITNATPIWEMCEPLTQMEGVEMKVDGDIISLVVSEEMMGWKPVLQFNQKSGQLFVGSTVEYIELCKNAQKGQVENLASDPEVVKLKGGLPNEFSNMVYVSPNFARTALGLVQGFGVPQIQDEEYLRPAVQMLLQKLEQSAVTQTGTLYAVSFGEKGTMHVVNSPLNMVGMESPTVTASASLIGVSVLFTGAKYYRDSANQAACVINMSSMQKAAEAIQSIEGHSAGDSLTWDILVGKDRPLVQKPVCPAGGVYTLNQVFNDGTKNLISCSCPGHELMKR